MPVQTIHSLPSSWTVGGLQFQTSKALRFASLSETSPGNKGVNWAEIFCYSISILSIISSYCQNLLCPFHCTITNDLELIFAERDHWSIINSFSFRCNRIYLQKIQQVWSNNIRRRAHPFLNFCWGVQRLKTLQIPTRRQSRP